MLPSRVDIVEHDLTHVPFRSCCAHCRRATARRSPHERATEEETGRRKSATTTYATDYLHMTERNGDVVQREVGGTPARELGKSLLAGFDWQTWAATGWSILATVRWYVPESLLSSGCCELPPAAQYDLAWPDRRTGCPTILRTGIRYSYWFHNRYAQFSPLGIICVFGPALCLGGKVCTETTATRTPRGQSPSATPAAGAPTATASAQLGTFEVN